MATYKLSIPTMKCAGCVSAVEGALTAINNVSKVVVDLESKQATVESGADLDIVTLIAAVTDSGFPATAL
ncbi:hypothetical protein MNBD_GAMMA22-2343 [hydrothermal vent metagenome]|uniref:HMA domain-containing protein n=1 Tax=hydrothermal vent metagenome TaxID=652676 RepID=A0A3B0ZVI7_9ZZZZ